MTDINTGEGEVTHAKLFTKLVEHEDKIVKLTDDVHGIKVTLEPIAQGVRSMAWSFKGLLVVGAASAAIVGIIELWERFA